MHTSSGLRALGFVVALAGCSDALPAHDAGADAPTDGHAADAPAARDVAIGDALSPSDVAPVADASPGVDVPATTDVAPGVDVPEACTPVCTGRACGSDGCGGSCGACAAGQTCSAAGACGAPPSCPTPAEIVVYTSSAWNGLASAFAADPSPCANYYLSVPAMGTPATSPRPAAAAPLRALGPQIHAMAEFHWASWTTVTGMTWYQKGVAFRASMAAAGYDVAAGDTWAINELPSGVRTDAATRQDARDVVRGLHDGPPGSPPARGAAFVYGFGQGTVNFSVYKPSLEAWLTDGAFWTDMNAYVRWWAQEVYTDPSYTCVGGTTVATRGGYINAFVEHVPRLAGAGPAGANTAQSYLSRAFVPLMNAIWDSPGTGYGTTTIPLDQMEHHVSGQVYAVRSWAATHTYLDGRIGFGWARAGAATDAELATLSARLASSIHHAYDAGGGTAAGACGPSGAYTWCQCSVPGASFNSGWDAFATW